MPPDWIPIRFNPGSKAPPTDEGMGKGTEINKYGALLALRCANVTRIRNKAWEYAANSAEAPPAHCISTCCRYGSRRIREAVPGGAEVVDKFEGIGHEPSNALD